jgi:hypothetical protein
LAGLTLSFIPQFNYFRKTPFDFDLPITRVVQRFQLARFDLLMRGIGTTDYPPQVHVWIGLGIVILYKSTLKWQTAVMGISSFGTQVFGLTAKFLLNRPRPAPDPVQVLKPAGCST